jgi:hypothetical protein
MDQRPHTNSKLGALGCTILLTDTPMMTHHFLAVIANQSRDHFDLLGLQMYLALLQEARFGFDALPQQYNFQLLQHRDGMLSRDAGNHVIPLDNVVTLLNFPCRSTFRTSCTSRSKFGRSRRRSWPNWAHTICPGLGVADLCTPNHFAFISFHPQRRSVC